MSSLETSGAAIPGQATPRHLVTRTTDDQPAATARPGSPDSPSRPDGPDSPGSPGSPGSPEHAYRLVWTLLIVCVTVFMLMLDVTVVAVALADIQHDLGGDLASLQWVMDAYTLTLGSVLLTAATLGDRIGRRRVFTVGLVVFTAASAGCAAAWSPLSLDLIRGAQGVGGALLMGTALPLLGATFTTPRDRARAIGAFGASLTAATALGPLIGGLLVDLAGWRWIFLINVPIGVLALLAIPLVRPSRSSTPRSPDWDGTLLLTAALLSGILALIRGNPDGWTSKSVLVLLAGSLLLLVGFVIREAAAAEPMLDLRLFAIPRFTGIGLGSFFTGATLGAAVVYLALYLQNTMDYSPLETGLRALPFTLTAFVAAPVGALLLRRVPLWSLVGGAILLSGGGLLLWTAVAPDSDWTVFLPGFVIGGIGLGMSGAVMSAGALAVVESGRSGMATGTVNALRQIGLAAGVAWLGAMFQHDATERSGKLLAKFPLPPEAQSRLTDAVGAGAGIKIADAVPEPLRAAVAAAGRTASAESLSRLVLIAGLVAVVSTPVCTALVASRRAGTAIPADPDTVASGSAPATTAPATTAPATTAPADRPPPPSPPGTGELSTGELSTGELSTGAESGLVAVAPSGTAPPGTAFPRSGAQRRSGRHLSPRPPRADEWPTVNPPEARNRYTEMTQVIDILHRAVPGLTGVMIASTDGLPLSYDFPENRAERVAAIAAATLNLAKQITENTELGNLHETVMHSDYGYLVVFAAGENGLLVLSGPTASNLGLMRLEARTATRAVSHLLDH